MTQKDNKIHTEIHVLIVSHARIGDAFKEVVEQIMGLQSNLHTIGFDHDDSIEKAEQDIAQCVASLDKKGKVIILTDMFGGTPCNFSLAQLETFDVEIIAGINLPFIIKLLENIAKNYTVSEAIESSLEAGKKYMRHINKSVS